jgi:hypothetical protein
LEFAELVYRACLRIPFDVLAVELPASASGNGILSALQNTAPGPGMVLQPRDPPLLMMVPEGLPGGGGPRLVRGATCYPLTPSDSILTALRCPALLQWRWPGWTPRLALVDGEPAVCEGLRERPTGPAPDDYEIRVHGLERFLESMESRLPGWGRIEEMDSPREWLMAERLIGLLEGGNRVLLVCGAAHWSFIRGHLDAWFGRNGGNVLPKATGSEEAKGEPLPVRPDHLRGWEERTRPDPEAGSNRIGGEGGAGPIVRARLHPKIAWLFGWLDDVPQVTWQFNARLERGAWSPAFDKRVALQAFWRAAFESARAKQIELSPRALGKMRQYLATWLCASGRWNAGVEEIRLTAEWMTNGRLAGQLEEAALECPGASGLPEAAVVGAGKGRFFVEIEGEVYLLGFPHQEGGPSRSVKVPRFGGLTREEQEQLRQAACYTSPPEETEQVRRMAARARDLAHGLARERRSASRRFRGGSLDLGLDIRATVRARAAGDSLAIHTRHRNQQPARASCDGMCPVVWIFDGGAGIRHSTSGCFPCQAHGKPGPVYSSFYWYAERGWVGPGALRSRIAYATTLLRGLADYYREDQVRALLEGLAESRLCRTPPQRDRDLRCFQGVDLAVAVAVKHAASHIVVVALPSQEFGQPVRDYAGSRGISVLRVSPDGFDRAALRRLSLDHELAAPGPFEKPFQFTLKQVEAL